MIDETHDLTRTSWVASANGHAAFPIQNLPVGVFSPPGSTARGGIAIGDCILDIGAALEAGLLTGPARDAAELASGRTLNAFLEAGPAAHRALRRAVSAVLASDAPATTRALEGRLLHDAAACVLHLPARIGDFTDFFAGIHHATAGGRINRPENPLMPNYKYVPVAYHSRASSVRVSGEGVVRPKGQRKPADQAEPDFGPCRNFDYELELGMWIGPGNELGSPIPIREAGRHVAGFCLLNDWSARDIQTWEYQPLGPFLAKNFQTTVSPWIITPEALAPFRGPAFARGADEPAPLPYLSDADDAAHGGLALALSVWLQTARMRVEGMAAVQLSAASAGALYWTVAQMVAHHASGGCNLRAGDLLGTGTISGDTAGSEGSLLELTMGGTQPLVLPNGETRRFLEDGDALSIAARGERPGFAGIGFGECVGVIVGQGVR